MLSMVVCSFSKSSDHFVDVNKMVKVIKIYFSSFIIFAGTGVCQIKDLLFSKFIKKYNRSICGKVNTFFFQ